MIYSLEDKTGVVDSNYSKRWADCAATRGRGPLVMWTSKVEEAYKQGYVGLGFHEAWITWFVY